MKILLIGRFYREGFALYIAEELSRMGHTVTRFEPGATLLPFGGRAAFYINRARSVTADVATKVRMMTGRDLFASRLRRVLEASGGTDLIVSTHDFLTPADAEALKAMTPAPLVLWYPDPVWSFRRHMFLNAPYDMLFFKDPYLVHMIGTKLGKRVFYMPECYAPEALSLEGAERNDADPGFSADLCIAGNLYAYRVALFEHLVQHDLKIWGLPAPPWLRTGTLGASIQNRFVAHAEKARAFRGARIVLNTLNPSEIWGTNVRTFEACGAGAFQIVDWRPGLDQLFEIGREVESFTDLADLHAKVARYLADPTARAAIAAAGQARARRDHTYRIRLGQFLATVAGERDGYAMPEPAWRAPRQSRPDVRLRA
ncbi:MAG: glycosyltransferase [Pseudomonadota bacterium]